MKFKVRDGFSLLHERKTGNKVTSTSQHWGGETVELSAKEALEHLHRLEPADKDAAQFLGQKAA